MLRKPIFTTLAVSILSLSMTAACAHSESNQQTNSDLRKNTDTELVEIIIRLPDGRVIKRKEPRIASKVDPKSSGIEPGSPPIVRKQAPATRSGSVKKTKGGVSGGTNSSSMKTGSASGGGSSSSGGGGGGGGGGGDSSTERGGSNSQGGGAGGTNDTIQPVQPDTDFTVRLYAWDNVGAPFQHVQKAIVVDPRGLTAKLLASRVADRVNAQNHDKVVFRFWKELEPATRYPFDNSDARELINSGGFTAGLTEYWTEFATELKALGITPDYLIFDQENGMSFWHIPVSQRNRFFSELLDPQRQYLSDLPPSMNGMRVEQFMNYRHPDTRPAFNDYNRFATEFRASMLRRVFHDTFEDVYGTDIPISNYGDFIEGFEVYTHHNRVIDAATIDGISAPVAFLDYRSENAPRYVNRSKHQRWNRLIDQLNKVRSAAQPGLVTPWIAAPGYGRFGPDTWARTNQLDEELAFWKTHMVHMLAMGVDTFIVWNPSARFNPNAITTDAMMDEWAANNPRVNTPQLRSLPEIPLDADYIETNGVITTYEQFLEFMNLTE